MDDVLDHIRALHDSRDIHGYLSLLVSTRGERLFGMRWKENGNVYKKKKGTQRCIGSCTGVQQLQVHRRFLSAGDMLPFSVLSQEKQERSGKVQWYLISGKSLLQS